MRLLVLGANTEVGKSLVARGLLRAWRGAAREAPAAYIKPVQTGTARGDDDSAFVTGDPQLAAGGAAPAATTLFSYADPVSPHVAVRDGPPSDGLLTAALRAELERRAGAGLVLVEGAGGVNSPTPTGTLQSDLFRGLALPAVLVADPALGGISASISAFESLLMRGIAVRAIVCFDAGADLGNSGAIRDYLARTTAVLPHQVPVVESLPPPPDMPLPLDPWFAERDADFGRILGALEARDRDESERVAALADRGRKMLWWPFTQHQIVDEVTTIESAYGDAFQTPDGPLFDACASWWTQGLGHGNPDLARAAAYAAGRYGHVMFPENVHEPAVELSEALLRTVGKGWASRVFFSDNGSTAIEVALKMALRASSAGASKLRPVALVQTQNYHGDTLGAMDVQCPSVYTDKEPWYHPRLAPVDPPLVGMRDGRWTLVHEPEHLVGAAGASAGWDTRQRMFDMEQRLGSDPLAALYRSGVQAHLAQLDETLERSGERLQLLLLEPVLLGAGGMNMADPLYQRILIEECRARGMPVIYDEVFVGFYRLGAQSAADMLGITPDISCYAKLLTGGLLPLSVTLATETIYNEFLSDSKADCLLHGHSYTAHPTGCQVALASLAAFERCDGYDAKQQAIADHWPDDLVQKLSGMQDKVEHVVSMGTVLAMHLRAGDGGGYTSGASKAVIKRMRAQGIFARPLGNVVYLMCAPNSDRAQMRDMLERVIQCL